MTPDARVSDERVLERCRTILATDPGSPPALSTAGLALVRLGRHAEARPLLETLNDGGRCEPEALIALGLARLHTGDLEGAANLFSTLLTSDPNEPRALRWLADVEERRGRFDAALALYRQLERRRDAPGGVQRFIAAKIDEMERRIASGR